RSVSCPRACRSTCRSVGLIPAASLVSYACEPDLLPEGLRPALRGRPGALAELRQPDRGPAPGAGTRGAGGRHGLQARPRVRLLLWRRPRGGVRLRDAAAIPRAPRLPLRLE